MSTNPGGQRRKYHVPQRVTQVSPSGIRRFFDLLASIEGVISLGVGEPDFATPWHICEAAISSLEKGYTMYTSNSGMPELIIAPDPMQKSSRSPGSLFSLCATISALRYK